jgi:hypothetical protein
MDLARQALAAAKAAARKNGTGPGAKPKPKRLVSVKRGTGGRDPMSLGTALGAVVVENGWNLEAKAGTVADRWQEIAPAELIDVVRPGRFDAKRRVLDLHPANGTVATRLRLTTRDIVARINAVVGAGTVVAIKVLPPGAGPHRGAPPPPANPHNPPAAPRSAPSGAPPNEALVAARRKAKEQREARDAAAAARAEALRSPWAHLCPIAREPEEQFLEGIRARAETEEQARLASHDRALAVARQQRRAPIAPAETQPSVAVLRAS